VRSVCAAHIWKSGFIGELKKDGRRREARQAAIISEVRKTALEREAPNMKKAAHDQKALPLGQAALDELIDEITTHAYGGGEQLWAFRQAFEDSVTFAGRKHGWGRTGAGNCARLRPVPSEYEGTDRLSDLGCIDRYLNVQ
jgi:hypothetical protein